MFEKLAETLLGSWGPAVLEFVYGNQLIISVIIVAWGLFMIIRKRKKQSDKENE